MKQFSQKNINITNKSKNKSMFNHTVVLVYSNKNINLAAICNLCMSCLGFIPINNIWNGDGYPLLECSIALLEYNALAVVDGHYRWTG